MDAPDRDYWATRWQDTVWEFLQVDRWDLLPPSMPDEAVVLSAWNPGGHRLPTSINHARDRILQAELVARGCTPLRVRGRSRDLTWCEEAWLIPHLSRRTEQLLNRYGQLAGWLIGPLEPRYVWASTR